MALLNAFTIETPEVVGVASDRRGETTLNVEDFGKRALFDGNVTIPLALVADVNRTQTVVNVTDTALTLTAASGVTITGQTTVPPYGVVDLVVLSTTGSVTTWVASEGDAAKANRGEVGVRTYASYTQTELLNLAVGTPVLGADLELYKLSADAKAEQLGDAADATARVNTPATHGQWLQQLSPAQAYYYSTITEPAAWVAWDGISPIPANAKIAPAAGVSSWEVISTAKDALSAIDVRINAQQGGNYSYLQGAGNVMNPQIVADVASGRLKLNDRIYIGSRFLFSEYVDGRTHGDFAAIVVPQTEGVNGDGIHFDAGSLRLKMVFPEGVYKVTQLGGKSNVADSSAFLRDITENIAAGKTLIFDDFQYNITGLKVFTGTTVRCNNGGSIRAIDNVATDAAANYYLLHNLGESNVTYDRMAVDGNAENNTLFNVFDAITCVGNGSKVINSTITNAADSGVFIGDGDELYAGYNRVQNCTDAGIYGSKTDAYVGNFSLLIEKNDVHDAAQAGITCKRVSENVTVDGNNVTGETTTGYALSKADSTAAYGLLGRSIFSNNKADITGSLGIAIHQSDGVSVSGGVIKLTPSVSATVASCITIDGSQDVSVSAVRMRGDLDTTPSTVAEGIRIKGRETDACTDIVVTGCPISYVKNARHVVYDAATPNPTRITFIGNPASNCTVNLRVDPNLTDSVIVSDQNMADCQSIISSDAIVTGQDPDVTATRATRVIGQIEDTVNTTPVGNVIPRSAGQIYHTTQGGRKVWISYGRLNTDWLQIGGA